MYMYIHAHVCISDSPRTRFYTHQERFSDPYFYSNVTQFQSNLTILGVIINALPVLKQTSEMYDT